MRGGREGARIVTPSFTYRSRGKFPKRKSSLSSSLLGPRLFRSSEIAKILDPGKRRSESSSMPSHFSSPIYHHLGVSKHEDKTVVRFGDHRILDELTVKKISDELFGVAAGAKCHHLIMNFTGVRGLST